VLFHISIHTSLNMNYQRSIPLQPSPRPWIHLTTRRTKSPGIPIYNEVNPFIYNSAGHSLTHEWPRHRTKECTRCQGTPNMGNRAKCITRDQRRGSRGF
jgi:hypothetical protein